MFFAVILFFISIVCYGFLNAWTWDRARRAFPALDRRLPSLLGLAAVLFLTAAPIATRILDSRGLHGVATVFSVLGDPWMAAVFWFCVLALILDLWDHAMRVIARRRASASRLAISARGQFLAAVSATVFLTAWGAVESSTVQSTTIRVASARLPAGSAPVTVAQLSDLHIGFNGRQRVIEQAARLVRERRPDIIVATGDVIDGGSPASRDLSPLAALTTPLGKFAVLGNHEHYTGASDCIAALRAAGFVVLIDETMAIPLAGGGSLALAGSDDPAGRQMSRMSRPRRGHELAAIGAPNPDEAEPATKRMSGRGRQSGALTGASGTNVTSGAAFVLRLRHRPDFGTPDADSFDLQLSGHTHGGQVWPFGYLVRLAHRYLSGMHELPGGRRLYVSRGIGTWGPPLRFLSPPEVVFILIEPMPIVLP